ncbi:MAG: adenosylcobinamide-GDP ribazoletransferase [Opitutales bacterium]
MKRELHIFFNALTYYTRLRAPSGVEYKNAYLRETPKYFPLIGWIVAFIGIAVLAAAWSAFSPAIAILLSMAATILATGAFHEDGFADSCDAFGGGWEKAQVLAIMKDSRLGTYGVIGLILLLGLKFLVLWEIGSVSFGLLLGSLWCGHTWSRFFAARLIQTHQYVRDGSSSKSKPITSSRMAPGSVAVGALFACASLLGLLHAPVLILALVPAFLVKNAAGWYFNFRLGGYTGDCLGAVQQITEVTFYLGVLALWNLL